MRRAVASALLLLLIGSTLLVLCAEGRRRGEERRRWASRKDRQRQHNDRSAEFSMTDEEDEQDEEAEVSDSTELLEEDDDTPTHERSARWHSRFSKHEAVHSANAERNERRRSGKVKSSETGRNTSKREHHSALDLPKWLLQRALRWPSVLQVMHTHARNSTTTTAKWYNGLNVCRTVKGQLPVEARVDKHAENDDGEVAESPMRGSGERTSMVACFETHRKRKCRTIYIDADGKKYEQIKIERCCQGFKVQKEMCVREADEPSDWENIVKQEGVTTFAALLSQLGMKPHSKPEVTLFAPSDEAMETFFSSLGINVTSIIISPNTRKTADEIKQLIRAHVHPDLSYMELTPTGQSLRTEHPNATLRIQHTRTNPTANCANLVKSDIVTMDGLLNVVDRVLLPVTQSLAERLNSNARLANFSKALTKIFGQDLANLGNEENPVTIFAPTNEAMAEIDRHTSSGSVCLERLLRQHIVPGFLCRGSLEEKAPLVSSIGSKLLLEQTHSGMTVAGSPIVDGDIVAVGGVIHIISKPIVDNSSVVDLEQKLNTENLASFLGRMKSAGMRLEEISNVTLLVPQTAELQKALQGNSEIQGEHDEVSLLNYHILYGQLGSKDFITNQYQTTLGVPVVLQTYSSSFPISDEIHTANCVRVIKKNVQACNAVIHVIEKALEPPSKTIYQSIRATPELKQFFAVLEQTSFAQQLDTVGNDMYTIYAPNNDAMNKLANVRLRTREERENFVTMHLVRGYRCCASLQQSYVNPLGIWFNLRHRNIQPFGTGFQRIVRCDSVSTNGVVHIINQAMIEQPHVHGHLLVPPLPILPFGRFRRPIV